MSNCKPSKLVVFAKFPKKGYRIWGSIAIHKNRKDERKGGKEKEKRVYLWFGATFWTNGYIANVFLGISLILSLACTQLCAKQLRMWTLCTTIGIAFGGGPIATQCLAHFPDTMRTLLYIPEKGWNESQRLLFDSRGGAWNSTSSIWHGSNMKRPNINNCYRVIIFQSLNGPF
jgi:hypothetical protein